MKRDVSAVSDVQVSVYAGLRCNGIKSTDVSDVSAGRATRWPDTADTSAKNRTYQKKPIVYAGCTPDTSDTAQTAQHRATVRETVRMATDMALKEVLKYLKRLDGAAPVTPPADLKNPVSNDHTTGSMDTADIGITISRPTATPPPPRKPQGQRYQEWVATWKPMADAYHAHHFGCPTCISAGKGYGLRCGVGAALWTAYTEQSAGDPP